MQQETLKISMFGGCSLTYGDVTLDDKNIRSKKIWTPLEYMIAFRSRDISREELIEVIDPQEKSENPSNTLKTLIHRMRHTLDELHMADGKDIIIQSRGSYAWNPQIPCEVDTELFESLCQEGDRAEDSEEKLQAYEKAIRLYKGDFLPKSAMESWAVQLNVYYHTMYINTAHKAVELYRAMGKFNQIVETCQNALKIDPYDEFFYRELILALVELKNSQAALDQYQKMSSLFYKEFGVTPSKELTKLYREIIKSTKKVETDLSVIKEDLWDRDSTRGAYFCEYEIFKDIYRLEVRSAARTGVSVYICLLTFVGKNAKAPALKMLNKYMDRLQDCICHSLRRGDVFSKYSVSQYILMLPTVTYETGEMVLNRIISNFRSENPSCPLRLEYTMQPLDMLM